MISSAINDLAISKELHVKKARLELIISNVNRLKTDSKGKAALIGNQESSADSPPKGTSKVATNRF